MECIGRQRFKAAMTKRIICHSERVLSQQTGIRPWKQKREESPGYGAARHQEIPRAALDMTPPALLLRARNDSSGGSSFSRRALTS